MFKRQAVPRNTSPWLQQQRGRARNEPRLTPGTKASRTTGKMLAKQQLLHATRRLIEWHSTLSPVVATSKQDDETPHRLKRFIFIWRLKKTWIAKTFLKPSQGCSCAEFWLHIESTMPLPNKEGRWGDGAGMRAVEVGLSKWMKFGSSLGSESCPRGPTHTVC